MYVDQARNHLYAQQGRRYANEYGQKVQEAFQRDADLEDHYHQLNDGKWEHMMSETRIGYNHWNRPVAHVRPVIYDYEPHGEADMGVAVEGMERPGQYQAPWHCNPLRRSVSKSAASPCTTAAQRRLSSAPRPATRRV